MNASPPSSLWECGNPAPFAGFPSAVETVEKSLLLLDFSTVSMARHFHSESLALCSSAPSPFFRPQIPPRSQKMKEQCRNVYENKGPLWKTAGEAGMLVKTKVITR
jgi:hypothetical protein